DQNGAVTGSYRYDSFGNAIIPNNLTDGYTGKWQREKDNSTGTIRMGAREYDPASGRFTSADQLQGTPTDPQQRNRYSYVGNDPLTRYDLSGMFTVTVDEVWAFGEGALTGAAACLAGAPGCAVVAVGATAAVIGYEGYQIYEEGGNPAERYDRYYEDNKCLMPPADAGVNWGPGGPNVLYSGAREATRSGEGLSQGKELSDEKAAERVANGDDVYVKSEEEAKEIARRAGGGDPVWEHAHGEGYYNHYHPSGHGKGHVFYGPPQ
ncbi:MAG: RHS repeat-associated core domain-containing protein, partial [Thermoleophilia bacterium]